MKKVIEEFKEFISKGNVIDLAVGVIIGASFGKIVTSLVNDVIMPLIGVILGGISFTDLNFKIKDATITYGNFIQNIIDFLIVAFCIFILVKFVNRLTILTKKEENKKDDSKTTKSDEVLLLEQIRDLLKKKK